MKYSDNNSDLIIAHEIPEMNRLNFLPRHLNKAYIKFEMTIYTVMLNFCPDYKGGYWDYFDLSNSGFYMAPLDKRQYRLIIKDNGFDRFLSADASGIVVTTFALNRIIEQTKSNDYLEKKLLLLEFVKQHKESAQIFAAID